MIYKILVEKIEKEHCVCAVKRDLLKMKEVKSVDIEKEEGLFTIIASEDLRDQLVKKLEDFGHKELIETF